MRRFDQALKALQDGLAYEPNDCQLLGDMAYCHLELDRPEAAQELARHILTFNPTYGYAFYVLARIEMKHDQESDAIKFLGDAIALEPTNANYLSTQAICHMNLGDPVSALRIAERGLALEPQHVELMNTRARALAEQGQHAGAMDALANAISLDPNAAATRINQGFIALKQNDTARARASFLEALRLQPNNAQSRMGLWFSILNRNPVSRIMTSALRWAQPNDWSFSPSFIAIHAAFVSLIYFGCGPENPAWTWAWVLWCLSIAKVPYSLIEDATTPVQVFMLSIDPEGRHLVQQELKQGARNVALVLGVSVLCAAGAIALQNAALGYASAFIFLLMVPSSARLFCSDQKLGKTFAVASVITTVAAVYINTTMLHDGIWSSTLLHVLLSWAAAEVLPWIILFCVGVVLLCMGKL